MSSSASMFFYEEMPEQEDALAQIKKGLAAETKSIPPKFFYDEKGSRLFTEITRQQEYYVTRTELKLLQDHAGEISKLIGDDSLLIEFGSGSSEKIRILLESLRPRVYAPLDISRDYLAEAAAEIAGEYPWLEVRATCLDYTRQFELPFELEARRVGFFPGSSIGNFDPADAAIFLRRVKELVGDNGGLLIGVDMKKQPEILNAAYNDANGITEAFNLNVLDHLNHEYEGNFNTAQFDHVARYNEQQGCVQMFLESQMEQTVQLAGQDFNFKSGERVHTENSFKYGKDEFLEMASRAGFRSSKTWQDDNGWFSIFYLY